MFFDFRVINFNSENMSFDDIFDQEKWPHCTLFAISLAVTNACADHNVRVTSLDVRTALFQYEDIYKKLKTGFFPENFDGKIVKLRNRSRYADDFLCYTIKIENMAVRKYREGIPAKRYVLVVWRYLNGDEDHCMYVIDKTERDGVQCFKCFNSLWEGGIVEREPLIEVSRQGNNLHRVSVTVNNRVSLEPNSP